MSVMRYSQAVKRGLVLAAAAALAAGCAAGNVPSTAAGSTELEASALLIATRFVLPTGETRNGLVELGLESETSREAGQEPIFYRLPLTGGESFLFRVEPGFYRFAPTRTWTGGQRTELLATIEGREYRMPFPRELLRLRSFEMKATKAVAVGVLEAKVLASLPGQKGTLKITVDDSVTARRFVVQSLIRQLMDPRRPAEQQASAARWSRALQNMLMELHSADEPRPSYKPAQ